MENKQEFVLSYLRKSISIRVISRITISTIKPWLSMLMNIRTKKRQAISDEMASGNEIHNNFWKLPAMIHQPESPVRLHQKLKPKLFTVLKKIRRNAVEESVSNK